MADITAEFHRVQSAYEQPTLALLARSTARATVAILRTLFTADSPSIPTARMHDQVNELLAEMRRSDLPDVPTGNGRDVCLRWCKNQWLYRELDQDQNEIYMLSSSAQDALRTIERLTKDRNVSLSGHLVAGLVHHLRNFSASVSPNADDYIDNLQSEKSRIQLEIDRVLDGGELAESTDDDIIQGFTELQRYLGELPSDFSRVVESYKEFREDTVSQFRRDSITSGQAVRSYIAYVTDLATSSASGRGFEGALQLIRDQDLLSEVRRCIGVLLDDDRASDLLTPTERAEIRNTVNLIQGGLSRVLSQRATVSRDLEAYIRSHDVDRDHELAATLRALEDEAMAWMQTAGPRAKAPLELLPGKPEMANLRAKMHDPANDQAPPPLTQAPAPEREPLTLAELRARGGPSHSALREALAHHLDAEAVRRPVAEIFHGLPHDLRRPVELVGLLPLVRRHGLEPTGEDETFETVRPDGTRRRFTAPRYAHPTPAAEARQPAPEGPSNE